MMSKLEFSDTSWVFECFHNNYLFLKDITISLTPYTVYFEQYVRTCAN